MALAALTRTRHAAWSARSINVGSTHLGQKRDRRLGQALHRNVEGRRFDPALNTNLVESKMCMALSSEDMIGGAAAGTMLLTRSHSPVTAGLRTLVHVGCTWPSSDVAADGVSWSVG